MIHASRFLSARSVNLAAISLLLSAAAFAQEEDPRGMKVLYREPRSALVIGNSAYASSPLANPVNDAESMARLLEQRNFKVTLLTNADLPKMEAAVDLFGQSLGEGGVGLFFYAGHGMQIEGRNYLIPVGARIENERDVKFNALDVGRVLGKMEDAGNRLNIVFLDACRDNPFARSFRTATTGLAQLDAPSGTLIAYATAPGKLAADGVDSNNSIYTRYLIEQLGVPGQEISPALQAVRRQVIESSGKRQIPWESTSLTGAFFLTPIDMLDENLALSRAQLESLKKLQAEQQQAAANLKKLETEKNAEMAKLDAEIARLRQQAQQPGQSGSSLDQLIALGDKRASAAAELAAAQRKAEEERQKRETEIAQVKAAARAKRKAEFEAAYAKYQKVCEYVDKGHFGAAEHQAAWKAICGDFGVKNPGDKPAALAWNDTDGTVHLASLHVYGLGGAGESGSQAITPAWPSLQIDGLRIEKKQDHLLIRFEDGAFDILTTLTPAAGGQLRTLVERLRPDLQAYRLVVEGHTDNIPIRATAAFADSAALAAARAETGVAYLKSAGAPAVAATSAGAPPYPNDTPDNRNRNRTLVIKLYRQ